MSLTEIIVEQLDDPRGGQLAAVLGVPEGTGPFVPLVVVHEVFGVDDSMRDHLNRLTRMGYLVIMPNLFSRGGARRCLVGTFRALRSGTGPAFADIEAARKLVLQRDDTANQVGVIGFCMGGGFALLLAGGGGYGAASVNYGMLRASLNRNSDGGPDDGPDDTPDTLEGACPIVGSYGGRDLTLRGAARKLEAALTARGIDHDVVEYPDAGHSFLNAYPAGPTLTRVMMKPVLGLGHRPVEAEDAWRRIDNFFQRTLA
jgi:carboxymethylenebutenolidase